MSYLQTEFVIVTLEEVNKCQAYGFYLNVISNIE